MPVLLPGKEVILDYKLLNALQVIETKWEKHVLCFSADILKGKKNYKSIRNESPNSVHFQEKGIFDSTLEGRHVGSFVDIFSSPHKRDKQDIY